MSGGSDRPSSCRGSGHLVGISERIPARLTQVRRIDKPTSRAVFANQSFAGRYHQRQIQIRLVFTRPVFPGFIG
jgi:hypothetical protein